jgi:acetoin utilization protein AcuC
MRTGRPAPELMTEGNEAAFSRFESGYDPGEPVDQAILATMAAVFPEHGLLHLP